MNRKIYKIHSLWSLLLLFVVSSCTSEIDEWQRAAKGNPIEIDFLMPDNERPETRTKTSLDDGDKIYLTAKVKLIDGSDDEIISTVLVYSSGKFQPSTADGATRLTWPVKAVSAEFRAYYLPETHPTPPSATPPAGTTSSVIIPLSELEIDEKNDDLLLAQQKVVNVNGVVTLRFAHTTTKLNITGLKGSGIETTLKLTPRKDDFKINNQLVISYSEAEGYTHKFENNGRENGITLTKTSGKTNAYFFLDVTKEWTGETFVFSQDKKNGGDTSSDEFPKETTLSDANSRFSTMKKGRAYYMSFYSGSASKAVAEEQWHKENKEERSFTTKGEIQAYFNGEGKDGLQHDLDFNNILLDEPIDITFPSTRGVALEKDFDGNHYTIRNVYVKNGLFNAIPVGRTIKNLRLENVKVIAENTDAAGLLAPTNAGTIMNVRIGGSNQIGTKGVTSVGGLVGINTGTIKTVQLSGALLMESSIEDDTDTGGFIVGGLVGRNTGTITGCEINAGVLLLPVGSYQSGEASIGGMVGSHTGVNTISDCITSVRVDASNLIAGTSYVGGFCGVNKAKLNNNKATGEIKGASFLTRSATGGFLGYTTSVTAVVNGCGATGNVTESAADQVTGASDLYTGGFCGFSEIDLKNTYSVGKLTPTTTIIQGTTIRRKGALTGLISADVTIYNSFSITDDGSGLKFSGSEDSSNICKTVNSHLNGKILDEQGVETGTVANIRMLNNAVNTSNGYWSWSQSSVIYGGVPYIIK